MLYLGIDQHRKQLTVSVRNEAGDEFPPTRTESEMKPCDRFLPDAQLCRWL